MSGVVNTGKKAVGAVSDTVRDIGRDLTNKPLKAIGELYTGAIAAPLAGIGGAAPFVRGGGSIVDGASPSEAASAVAKTTMAPFMPDRNLPNIAIQDPKAVKARADAEREAASRQAQIDQLTDAPGRGGTILTDKYTYRT